MTWDLTDGGTHAVCEKRALIALIRDRVSYIEDWWIGDGKTTEFAAKWRRPGDTSDVELTDAYQFNFEHGEKRLLCFDEERNRDEILSFSVRRVIEDGFAGKRDWVQVTPWTSAKKLTIRVVWSAEKPPQSVELLRDGSAQPSIDAEKLHRDGDERAEYCTTLSGVSPGEAIELRWTIGDNGTRRKACLERPRFAVDRKERDDARRKHRNLTLAGAFRTRDSGLSPYEYGNGSIQDRSYGLWVLERAKLELIRHPSETLAPPDMSPSGLHIWKPQNRDFLSAVARDARKGISGVAPVVLTRY